MKLSSILIVYIVPRTKEQASALQTVEKALKKHSIRYQLEDRDSLSKRSVKGKDLIIVIGGDGTFLRAAQFVDKEMLFGVNSDPRNKEGFFMKADKSNFEAKLKKIVAGKIRLKMFPRLEASIDNKPIGVFALNEFYIGPRKAYHAAKYIIKVGGKQERHKSSGVLVTTPAGSYSWAKSCCGRSMNLDSKNFQYIVREPYQGKIFRDYKLTYGMLKKNQKAEVISEMLDGVVVADSVSKDYNFKEGSKAKIGLSDKSIRVVWS